MIVLISARLLHCSFAGFSYRDESLSVSAITEDLRGHEFNSVQNEFYEPLSPLIYRIGRSSVIQQFQLCNVHSLLGGVAVRMSDL